ncbi:sigma-70 family RNA polymerase sigma factor [Salinibacillus xinjiangensis]|uniref:RNA polymerase sigma factor n=1 Tax=Salinibacillus xinjiangensis TaxID=1229268 RepID=A0A6G1X8B7_9BACI|nr:sigma-70 family RNA polymerase sigma factor [Salinibacillus xinjiangensis]MRG87187.1 sigma-70 family RNA polymerase sigma factor [Salinibacillus xinjiangensis]
MDIQQLYKEYIHDVYRYLLSLCKDKSLAEDLTQDTFMKAYIALENSPPTAMKSWLMKIAYHTFIDFARRSKKVNFEEPDYFSLLSTGKSAEDEFYKTAEKDELYYMLNQLKTKQKQAIVLCDLQGYSYKEAAAILSMKENTLKTHIFRGRGKLRQLYKKGSVEE